MKKIIVLLFIMISLLAFGQKKEFLKDLKVTEEMKTVSPNSNVDITTVIPRIERPFKMRLAPSIQKANITFLVDGVPYNDSSALNNISAEDVESITILKDPEHLNIFGDTDGVMVITTKKKEEYETIVFAPGFESFVTTQPSKSYFTESWLKSKNILLVTEWNYRHSNPSRYTPRIYEEAINYESDTEYGLDVKYTLYMFFRFMEKENNMSLIGDRRIAEKQ